MIVLTLPGERSRQRAIDGPDVAIFIDQANDTIVVELPNRALLALGPRVGA